MIPLQYQALEQYSTWLNLPYQAHLTVRLQQPNRSSQQLNRDLIRAYLVPLQSYCGTRIVAVTAIMRSHAHCFIVAPDTALDIQQLESFASGHGDINHGPKVTARPIYPGTVAYVMNHLIAQDGALHFFNINHLNLKD